MKDQTSPGGRIIAISNPSGLGHEWMLFGRRLEELTDVNAVLVRELDFAALEMRVLARELVDLPQPTPHKFIPDEAWRRQGKRRGKHR